MPKKYHIYKDRLGYWHLEGRYGERIGVTWAHAVWWLQYFLDLDKHHANRPASASVATD